MGLTEFDNGYCYPAELKKFAKENGIVDAGSLRKDELEHAVKLFLKTGRRAAAHASAKGVAITYRDVVEEYVRLSPAGAPFEQIPHDRYINFVADFFIKAWAELKRMDVPKTYRAWVASKRKRA